MGDDSVDLWALDEVHFQQQGSRCRMWVPPEIKDPVVYHHPTRKSVGYFAAVRLRDGQLLFRRETGRFSPLATMPNIIAPNCIWIGACNRRLSSAWTSCHLIVPN